MGRNNVLKRSLAIIMVGTVILTGEIPVAAMSLQEKQAIEKETLLNNQKVEDTQKNVFPNSILFPQQETKEMLKLEDYFEEQQKGFEKYIREKEQREKKSQVSTQQYKQKYDYKDVLPRSKGELSDKSKRKVNQALSLSVEQPQNAAEMINTYEEDVFEVAVREVLDSYYEDADQVERTAINTFTEYIDEKADSILKGYEEALEERQNSDNLDYETEHVILVFDEGTTYEEIQNITERIGDEVYILDGTGRTLEKCIAENTYMGWKRLIARVNIGVSQTVKMAVNSLESVDGIYLAECNSYCELEGVTEANDPYNQNQAYLDQINVSNAWDDLLSSYNNCNYQPVTVAVLDSGAAINHKDFQNIISEDSITFSEKDEDGNYKSLFECNNPFYVYYDDEGNEERNHGTHVAGIIAAQSNNGLGTTSITSVYNSEKGTCENLCELLVINLDKSYTNASITEAINYANLHGAKVINMSIGFYNALGSVENAIQDAHNAGIVVVASAGNNGKNVPHYPSDYEHVISVASLNADGETKRTYSNYGDNIDLAAPGTDIYSVDSRTETDSTKMTGTSMSAAIVSATAAFMLSINPSLTPDEVEYYLANTADDLYNPGWDQYTGSGRVNVGYAVEQAKLAKFYETDDEVDVIATSDRSNSIKLSIGITPTTEYYQIVRTDEDGSRKTLIDRLTFDNVSQGRIIYEDTDVELGKTYYYEVTDRMDAYVSRISQIVSFARNDSPTPLAAQSKMKSLQIWESTLYNNNIFIYYDDVYWSIAIYRSDTYNGTYTSVGEATSNYFIDTTAEKGKTYYYKALAHTSANGNFYSSGYSNIISMTIE